MDDDSAGLIVWLAVAAIALGVYWVGFDVAWYSLRYMVSPSKVQVDAKPRDCFFMTAPLGDKGCHYKAAVSAVNTQGILVGGDNAPKYGHDTKTGKPIISYDQGKTWNWMITPDVPDQKIDKVVVTWDKVTE